MVEAGRQGAEYIETDIRRTSDGVPVLCHDKNLKRLFERPERLDSITSDEFARQRILGSGTTLTLDQLLALNDCPRKIVLDIKESGLERTIVDMIAHRGREDDVIVSSFYSLILMRFRKLNPNLKTAIILDTVASIPLAMRLTHLYRPYLSAIGADHLHIYYRRSNLAGARKLVKLGYKVAFWTVDDADDARDVLPANPYGIITNKPAVIGETF
jgi:glycerophosphoryl diester phosphodiesterase